MKINLRATSEDDCIYVCMCYGQGTWLDVVLRVKRDG